mgnify:CR=1 FL=1
MNFEYGGYTGGLMERETLGSLPRPETEGLYVPFHRAMEWAEKHQFGDPTDPDPRFANDLHATVAQKLEIEDLRRVKFFTAVGSPLDHYHGIDAFFKVEWNGKNFVVTLDVTMNPNKGDNYKADVVFYISAEGLDPRDDRKEYLEKIEEVAEMIVDKIKSAA